MSRLIADTPDQEAADYFTCLDFQELIKRYKKDVRLLSPEARKELKEITDELKAIGTLQ